jgi:hypothetical protein
LGITGLTRLKLSVDRRPFISDRTSVRAIRSIRFTHG